VDLVHLHLEFLENHLHYDELSDVESSFWWVDKWELLLKKKKHLPVTNSDLRNYKNQRGQTGQCPETSLQ
jgi:hypothetical protein